MLPGAEAVRPGSSVEPPEMAAEAVSEAEDTDKQGGPPVVPPEGGVRLPAKTLFSRTPSLRAVGEIDSSTTEPHRFSAFVGGERDIS